MVRSLDFILNAVEWHLDIKQGNNEIWFLLQRLLLILHPLPKHRSVKNTSAHMQSLQSIIVLPVICHVSLSPPPFNLLPNTILCLYLVFVKFIPSFAFPLPSPWFKSFALLTGSPSIALLLAWPFQPTYHCQTNLPKANFCVCYFSTQKLSMAPHSARN